MAKEYAYYLEGGKLAVVERDTSFDNNVESKEFGPGVSRQQWKSPKSSITDGLEIKYAYSPIYNLYNDENTGNFGGLFHVNGWTVLDGYVCFVRSIDSGTATWTGVNPVTAGTQGDTGGQSLDYIVVSGSSRWNGLHKVQTAGGAYGTLLGGIIKTYTRARAMGPFVTAVDLDLAADETVYEGGSDGVHMADRGFEVGDYVWMSGHTGAGTHNGVFTISAVTPNATATSSTLTFDTRYYLPTNDVGGSWDEEVTAAASFTADTDGGSKLVTVAKIEHEICKVYTDVDVLNDEADNIDLPSYLQKALVYYVKAKVAEDSGNFDVKEYMQREFRRMIEKYESTLVRGPRIMSSGFHAIR